MTRWARSGSTQNHKRMPGVATPWSELSHQDQESQPKKQKKRKQNFDHQTLDNIQVSSFGISIDKSLSNENNSGEASTQSKIKLEKESGIPLPSKLPTKKEKNAKKFAELPDIKNELDQPGKSINESPAKSLQNKAFEKKKGLFMEKLKQKRGENGIVLLPAKIERKLYNIKKKLREKGFPPVVLKEIIRKERRKEEIKFRKVFNPSKRCYNCRKIGHMYADCPEKANSVKQSTGICFKCGSDAHTSYKCPSKIQGYPLAKCFICKEQGHITRDCPKNERGIYPKGGRCNLCGNVNHLRKDCPSLSKKKEEPAITLHTIKEVTGMDAEIIDHGSIGKRKNIQKPKVVKF